MGLIYLKVLLIYKLSFYFLFVTVFLTLSCQDKLTRHAHNLIFDVVVLLKLFFSIQKLRMYLKFTLMTLDNTFQVHRLNNRILTEILMKEQPINHCILFAASFVNIFYCFYSFYTEQRLLLFDSPDAIVMLISLEFSSDLFAKLEYKIHKILNRRSFNTFSLVLKAFVKIFKLSIIATFSAFGCNPLLLI